ncbi:uncharacterized protein N7459_002466 [Penicillium hispanicum]|uniref:uncharacterized protein n=1 Tax=Penicillium hispanicum TaxID=1080232 RepID=UPI00253F7599|nr:uncharacterized protein N7459_002466 [Penicillium hispanicum]KAJ5586701.1 hypothetical protein N7459_002466 [Penicillium hispanicum]
MIVFFDVLLLDDDVCLRMPHRERRLRLQRIIQRIPGRADIAEQEILDFGRQGSQHRLEVSFSKAISQRWEGLVVKACDEPYFPIHSAGVDTSFGRWIKLKKDYIPGLGDTVDLALVGASYDAQHATALSTSKKLQWTHFLVGCLLNKDEVELSGAIPRFRLVDVLNRHCMHRRFMVLLNHIGAFSAQSPDDFHGFETEYGHGNLPAATVLFKKPFVVEMMGSGFEKPSGARYFTLRFPRILKVHMDRTFEDAASFRELQIMAEESRSVPEEDIFAEREHWYNRLKAGNGLNSYVIRRSQSPSRSSSSSAVSDADSVGDFAMTPSEGEDVAGAIPSIRSHQGLAERANQGQMYSSIEGAPAVYVDETLTHIHPVSSESNRNVLTENGNLSSRHYSGQKGPHAPSPLKRVKTSTRERPSTSGVSRPSGLPINSLVSMHRDHIHSKLAAGQDPQNSRVPETYSKPQPPISPLTTIPVYMRASAPEMSAGTQDRESRGLAQFLRLIGSIQTTRIIQRSNPRAVSQGTALGIVLVNLVQTSLGPEIHRISSTLSKVLAAEVPSGPSQGKIFFLDSLILEQNIRPDDPRFCLRQTWSEIGSQFFYACLRWNVHRMSRKRKVGDETNPGDQEEPNSPNQGDRPSVSLVVGFDESEVLAAGEYISIEPPLHST